MKRDNYNELGKTTKPFFLQEKSADGTDRDEMKRSSTAKCHP
jgi:hypothetical protein